MAPKVTIRAERPTDRTALRRVLLSAFPTAQEADLVDRLRRNGRLTISLIAESSGEMVGQVAFSAVTIGGRPADGVGLAPLAVRPEWQRHGIGAQLVRAGVAACERASVGFIVLLGEPQYYRRFGFITASDMGLSNEYGADDAFMVLELTPRSAKPGGVRYAPEFNDLQFDNQK
jgi:putative acetyltransferase